MLELYERIRMRREELNLSQDELAKKLGYKTRSSINKIEKGINDIPQSKIKAFAIALDTTPEYLMGWTDNKGISDQTLSEGDRLALKTAVGSHYSPEIASKTMEAATRVCANESLKALLTFLSKFSDNQLKEMTSYAEYIAQKHDDDNPDTANANKDNEDKKFFCS